MNKAFKIGIGFVGIIFVIIGLTIGGCFIIVSAIMGKITGDFEKELEEFRPYANTTSGYVEYSYDGHTLITYYDNEGNGYNKRYNSSSTDLEGTTVTVYYDKDDPASCMVPEVESGVLQLLGNIFLIVGIVLIVIFCGIGISVMIGCNAVAKKMQAVQTSPEENNEEQRQFDGTSSFNLGVPYSEDNSENWEQFGTAGSANAGVPYSEDNSENWEQFGTAGSANAGMPYSEDSKRDYAGVNKDLL